MSATDTLLDAVIHVFYFDREGVDPGSGSYLHKQRDRVASILGWIEGQLRGPWLTDEPRFGVAEIMLITVLDWLVFRERYPVDSRPALAAFRAAHADRPSIRSTCPVG
jgi:glutathione S-transferase